jgi:hypothetical protein
MFPVLTEENILKGRLSKEDFARAIGYKVSAFKLSEFPHYPELQKTGLLPPDKIRERGDAIYDALKKAKSIQPHGPFDAIDCQRVADNDTPFCWSEGHTVFLPYESFFRHFELIRSKGFEAAHEPDSAVWLSNSFPAKITTPTVFPGLLNEKIPLCKGFQKYAAFILVHRDCTSRQFLAEIAGVPESLLAHVPEDGAHCLFSDIHEQRHPQQIHIKLANVAIPDYLLAYIPEDSAHCLFSDLRPQQTHLESANVTIPESPYAWIPEFYSELDADMTARAELRQAGIGEETSEACLNTRYLEMLSSPDPFYWFASTLESLEARQKPKDCFTTFCAVEEIRLRLILNHNGKDSTSIFSEELQTALGAWKWDSKSKNPDKRELDENLALLDRQYGDLANSLFGKNPAPLCTGLRQLVEGNVFTDPFAKNISSRILDAATYFNPDLIHADDPSALKRMNARLGALTI